MTYIPRQGEKVKVRRLTGEDVFDITVGAFSEDNKHFEGTREGSLFPDEVPFYPQEIVATNDPARKAEFEQWSRERQRVEEGFAGMPDFGPNTDFFGDPNPKPKAKPYVYDGCMDGTPGHEVEGYPVTG